MNKGFINRWLADLQAYIRTPVAVGLFVFVGQFFIFGYLGYITSQHDHDELHHQAAQVAGTARAILENSVNDYTGALQLTQVALLLDPHFSSERLNLVGREFKTRLPALLELQLAPGGIIKHVYPLPQEAAVRGLNVLEIPGQKEVALETIESGEMRIAGPVDLVQGGWAFVARHPAFFTNAEGDRYFWGFVTELIDAKGFLSILDKHEALRDVDIAVRGKDSTGADGQVFWGSETLFSDSYAALSDVTLPGQGEWQVAVRLPSDEIDKVEQRKYIYCFEALIGALAFALLFGLSRSHRIALERSATIDLMTGGLLRAEFYERARREWQRSKRSDSPCSLIAFDLDHFKHVNDNYGHAAGDKVLIEIGRRVRSILRTSDHFGRIGGEEFAIVVSDTDREGAYNLAERIRAEVSVKPVMVSGQTIYITASFGVAEFRIDGGDLDTVLDSADKALYAAKAAGRNCSRKA